MSRRAAAAAFLMALSSVAGAAEFGPWERDDDEGGIVIEVRKDKTSGIIETRATTVVNCAPSVLWKELTTPDSYVKLMPGTLEDTHLEERPDEGWLTVYQKMDGSPSSDRDYTLLVKWRAEDGAHGTTYHREWVVANDKGPPPAKDVVRVLVNRGHWKLTPADGGRTAFEYQNYIELGGSLWTRLANGAAKDTAKGFLQNLRKRFP